MLAQARVTLLAVAVALLGAVPAVAMTPRVKDDGSFFTAAAVEKANQVIRTIKDEYHKDLVIETVKTVPKERADKVEHMDRSEREHFFEEWARERAREEDINGVYVLICKEPAHLQVEVGNETRQRAFTVADRDHLRDILVKAFKAKEYDRGLLDGVLYVRDTMRKNLGDRGRAGADGPASPVTPGGLGPAFPGQSRPWLGLGSLVLGLLCLGVIGLFVIIALVSWLARAGRGTGSGGYAPGGYAPGGYGPAPGYGSGGGGGFFSSLLGSLFGSAAGNWVYDRMFHGGGSNTGGYTSASPVPPPDTLDRPDTDYSGAGGDFGSNDSADQDTGGGGDFGGSVLGSGNFYGSSGDSSGGDFGGGGDSGGGDSGGGGDF
jgi:hypothetical protein